MDLDPNDWIPSEEDMQVYGDYLNHYVIHGDSTFQHMEGNGAPYYYEPMPYAQPLAYAIDAGNQGHVPPPPTGTVGNNSTSYYAPSLTQYQLRWDLNHPSNHGTGTDSEQRQTNPVTVANGMNPDEMEVIFRETLQHEGKTFLSRLVLARKILEEQLKRPQAASPIVLIRTKLAIVKMMIHYAIFRTELLRQGIHETKMVNYHRKRILEILESVDTPRLAQERSDLLYAYRHVYNQQAHDAVLTFFAWMKNHLPNVSRERIFDLEKTLPMTLFDFDLEFNPKDPQDHKDLSGKRGSKRPLDDVEPSDSEEEEAGNCVLERNLRGQITNIAPLNIFPGRFELPEGRTKREYPPGYFDPMIDTRDVPFSLTFPDYFNSVEREKIPQFSGDAKGAKIAYPTFFEKYRVAVHLKREDRVSLDNKFVIFKSLMVKGSKAENMLRLYTNMADIPRAYDHCMREFWKSFGCENGRVLARIRREMNRLKPADESNQAQLDFVYAIIDLFHLLHQSGMSEKAAAKHSCQQIFDNLDDDVVQRFIIQTKMEYQEVETYFKHNPRKHLEEIPTILRRIFEAQKRKESPDEDVCLTAKATVNLDLSAKKRGDSSTTESGKRVVDKKLYACPFCGKTGHAPFSCPKTVEERIKVVKEKGLCQNCLNKKCPGGSKCERDSFCRTCRETAPTRAKHSSWICINPNNQHRPPNQGNTTHSQSVKRERTEGNDNAKSTTKGAPRVTYSPEQAAKIVAQLVDLVNPSEAAIPKTASPNEPGN